jgi:hypothetical protein
LMGQLVAKVGELMGRSDDDKVRVEMLSLALLLERLWVGSGELAGLSEPDNCVRVQTIETLRGLRELCTQASGDPEVDLLTALKHALSSQAPCT